MQQKYELLNREDAAKYLGVSYGTLEVWASTKRYNLPYVKIGARVMYRSCDLDTFIEQRMVSASHV